MLVCSYGRVYVAIVDAESCEGLEGQWEEAKRSAAKAKAVKKRGKSRVAFLTCGNNVHRIYLNVVFFFLKSFV